MTPPASGYFTASATTPPMPAWFYFSACSNMDATQISCPNPDRRRQLQFGPTGGGVMAIQYWGETPCEAGAPCTLQDSCATLGTFPPPTCIANGTAGLICSYSGGSGARSVDLDFVCAVSAGALLSRAATSSAARARPARPPCRHPSALPVDPLLRSKAKAPPRATRRATPATSSTSRGRGAAPAAAARRPRAASPGARSSSSCCRSRSWCTWAAGWRTTSRSRRWSPASTPSCTSSTGSSCPDSSR